MDIITVSNKSYTISEFYNKQPMQMVDMKMNMLINNNLHRINALDRNTSHLLLGKYYHTSFPN